MRVLQLGVGAVGEVNARGMAREPVVEAVVLAGIDEGRLRDVAAKLPPDKVEMLVTDASDHTAPVRGGFCAEALEARARSAEQHRHGLGTGGADLPADCPGARTRADRGAS